MDIDVAAMRQTERRGDFDNFMVKVLRSGGG